MNKMLTKTLAGAVRLTLSLTLCACGGRSSPEDALTRAQAAFADVKSMHYTIDMDMGFSADGESMEMNTTAEADCIVDPIMMDMDMTMDMMGLFDMDLKMYVVQDGSSYTMYTGMDNGDGTMSWSKDTLDDLGDIAQYNGKASMDIYLENGSNFKEIGAEDVDGVSAVRYDGVISQDSLKSVMDTSGVLEQYESLGLEGMEDLLDEMGDLPVSIWLDPDSDLPVKYEMDMTQMMQNMMNKLLAEDEATADVGFTVDKCVISMVCSDYNTVSNIEIPEEALNADSYADSVQDLLTQEETEAMEEALEEAA